MKYQKALGDPATKSGATNQSGGFGLGLNIVNMICKTYNIKIDVQSSENIGSTFTLKL